MTTLTSIAKDIIKANPSATHLDVRTAQLAWLKTRKNTAANRLNIAAWERTVSHLEAE